MKRNQFLYLFLTVLVSVFTTLAVLNFTNKKTNVYSYSDTTAPVIRASYSPAEFPDFTFAAENSVKSVVHVKVVKRGTTMPGSIFDYFFGYGQPQMPREMVGAGSGVIITNDGYIVTNNHVIEGADEIEVTLENNHIFKAKLIGADPATDIALIKIEAEKLPFLPFGDSDALRLGEWVLAIGNPYNLRSTITAGIVSAKGRSMPSPDGEFRIESFIQTDAAVNQGNSGGALVNTRGELVGINTAIASRTGTFTGYSFAVPVSIVKKIVHDILDFGSVQRAMLGITMQNIDGNLAKERGLKDTRGVLVVDVVKGSAAEKAGIKESDVLVAVNGVKISSSSNVQEQVSRFRPKDKITVDIIRDGKQKEISVVLDGREATIALLESEKTGVVKLFGADLREAPQEKLTRLNIRHGIEVVSVSQGKFKETGINEGFIITHINQIPVRTIQELQNVVQRSRRSLLIEGVNPDGKVFYYGMGL